MHADARALLMAALLIVPVLFTMFKVTLGFTLDPVFFALLLGIAPLLVLVVLYSRRAPLRSGPGVGVPKHAAVGSPGPKG
jgi:hypothetical protein